MKQLTLNWSFILLLLISLTACGPSNSERKIEYNGKLQYFTDRNGFDHVIKGEKENGHILLPECFKLESFATLSLTDKYVYRCEKNDVYITIDPVSKEKFDEYASTFQGAEIKNTDNLSILSNYMVSYKSSSLLNVEQVKRYQIQTETNETMKVTVLKGWNDSSKKEHLYQLGVIEGRGNYYILQSVIDIDNASFLSEDVIKIFRSFES